ncbi:MFS transporter [Pseudalkalibacillus sp. Hm43]|uniref:MFS transporter n=1 Tax=Pseudalkalibacillus sp. Hm43 TaxID=3450742 RepID=UPI003F440B7D
MNKRRFYPFLGAKTLMALADVLYIMTIVTYIYQKTGSATYAAIYPLLQVIASLIAGFTTPLFVERFKFNGLLINFTILKTVLLIALPFLFPYISDHLVGLFLFIAILSFISGWTKPLLNTMIPKVVEKDHLVTANSYLTFSNHSVQLAGYSFTGLVVVAFGEISTLSATATLQGFATILLLTTLVSVPDEQPKPSPSKWKAIKDGWLLLWNNKTILVITIMDMIEGIAGTIWVGAITLVFVQEALNQGAEWWGFINSSYYAGTILGGVLALLIAKKVQANLIQSMAIGSFLFGILTFLYGINSVPWLALVLCVLMGPSYQIRDIAQQTAMQTSVSTERLPKIYATHGILISTIGGISVLLVGMVADFVGIRFVYIFASILISCSALLSFTLLRFQAKKAMQTKSYS